MYVADGPQKVTKIFCKEAVMWKRLKHPNIVPLLGVTITPLQLISTWMPGGNLPEYIKTHPNADRLEFLSDVAKGLCYLHSYNAIHGDIKGVCSFSDSSLTIALTPGQSNILVDDSGHARISDFGLATVTKDVGSTQSTSYHHGLAPRWTAPEVLNEGTYSKAADVFSFAMLMIEVFTGAIPFSDSSSFMAVLAIMQGKRPPRPTHPAVTEDLWILMQRCWDHDPRPRPEISEVLRTLLTSDPPAWKRLISHPSSTNERISLLTSIFSERNEVKMIRHLSGDDARALVDVIDETLDRLPQQIHRRCLRYLHTICGRQALLPKSLQIPLCYNPTAIPECSSRFADVWKGRCNGREVAAKALRVYSTNDFEQIRKVGTPQLVVFVNELAASCTEVLQGSRNMEDPASSERVAADRRDDDREAVRHGI
ncbi:kinase-like protein [Thelephora ganbajun]|uniref:Kinase-like protein n=1 Tax=Thelephora ganbajun TaxID=370292 RepID=A0ACB6Z405_THEGA|nr:kinase-like protein [Thelephora ganbajun]